MKKIVYQDQDYTKVLFGAVDLSDSDFVIVTGEDGKKTYVGRKFIISIAD